MTSTDERRFDVLRAIVTDYVNTQEPIGSKALVERHQLGVSSATVRNDMAVLEAEGYIAQPHTSSGRVPTDKGYRLFVDRISEIKPLSQAERRAILSVLDSSVDLDDVLRRSVKLLAELTRHVAVIQYPVLSTATVRHLEVVALTSARLLLVVITDSGRVEQRMVALVMQAVQRIVADFGDRERVVAVVKGALAVVRNQKQVTLRVSPSQLDDVRASVNELLAAFPGVGFLDLVPDARLGPDACILESEIGVVEASIAGQLGAIEKAFASILGSRA